MGKIQGGRCTQSAEIYGPSSRQPARQWKLLFDSVPPLEHWTGYKTPIKKVQINSISPSEPRSHWSQLGSKPMHPPLTSGVRYSEKLSKKAWNIFWQSNMPHAARTPWWRLLNDKIPHRARLRRHQPDTFETDQCIICNQHVEVDFHFVVGCFYKWQVWSTAVKELGWSSHAISKENIWKNMLLQDKTTLRLVNNAIEIGRLDTIWAAVWQMHWQCTFEQTPWNSERCLSSYRQMKMKWNL